MARVNAQQYVERWSRKLKQAGQDITTGVNNTSEAPGAAAARSEAKMLNNTTEAITSGRWKRNVSAVTLEDWKRAMINKGIGRIAAGVDGAQQSQLAMAERLLAAVDSVAGAVRQMPNTTLEDSINRMVAFARGMAEKKL